MKLLEKLRKQRNKRIAKKKIRQGFVALVWISKRQVELGWNSHQRKQWWQNFVRSPQARARIIKDGLNMVKKK